MSDPLSDKLLTLVSQSLAPENPEAIRLLALVFSPLVGFFAVPVLFALMGMVMLDFLTGLYKAALARRISSNRFGDVFFRAIIYAMAFVTLHLITVSSPAPFNLAAIVFEGAVMTGMLSREALSVLENLKAIAHVKGIPTPWIDATIHKLGLDQERMLKDFEELQPSTLTTVLTTTLSTTQTQTQTQTSAPPEAPAAPPDAGPPIIPQGMP